MAIVFGGGLGDVTNFVSFPADDPSADPWITDYTAPADPTLGPTEVYGDRALGPTEAPGDRAITVKTTAAKAAPAASGVKVAVKRAGTAGSILDKLLPLMRDAAGTTTIYGLPPAIVYLLGGVLSATVIAYLVRMLGGGRRLASNPKRHPARRRRAKRQS
jgi:hypothetical protein